jgi:polyisoprenoid-binding protein YceI
VQPAGGRRVEALGYRLADPAAIDTGNARRDRDLRGKRFLKVDDHPRLEVTAERVEATAAGWAADATLRAAGTQAPLRVEGALAGPAAGARLRVSGSARLDIRTIGIRVPGFMVGRYVEITVTAELTQS